MLPPGASQRKTIDIISELDARRKAAVVIT
jgi:hypothetical protein